MARGGQAVEGGIHQAEEAAEQALAREELADEVADVAGLDVLGLQPGRGQALRTAWAKASANSRPWRDQFAEKSLCQPPSR